MSSLLDLSSASCVLLAFSTHLTPHAPSLSMPSPTPQECGPTATLQPREECLVLLLWNAAARCGAVAFLGVRPLPRSWPGAAATARREGQSDEEDEKVQPLEACDVW